MALRSARAAEPSIVWLRACTVMSMRVGARVFAWLLLAAIKDVCRSGLSGNRLIECVQ